MRRSLGSLKAAWIWLVKAPGVNRPAMDEQPMYLQAGQIHDTGKSNRFKKEKMASLKFS